MEFTIKTGAPEKLEVNSIIVGVFAENKLSPAARKLDDASKGRIGKILERGELKAIPGSLLVLHDLPNIDSERVVLVRLENKKELSENGWRKALRAVATWLSGDYGKKTAIALAQTRPDNKDFAWALQQCSREIVDAHYSYHHTKTQQGKTDKPLSSVILLSEDKASTRLETAVQQGQAIANGMALTRELGNLPANICTPQYLADKATELAETYGCQTEIFDQDGIEKLGMGSFLSVAQGAERPPRFIVMQYQGAKSKEKPIVLVGKGITFDSGGISLKPGEAMDEMKFDMCGAASVFGTFRTVLELQLPLNVVAIVAAAENMPSGRATRPGDIVTSMSGQTIEVLNTDAEGRLILCDALTYAERFEPACVIDIATLTGACIIALGKHTSGLLTNNDKLAEELSACGHQSGDRVWQLPLWEEYQEQLKSNFADMANIGGRAAGTITAACFLSRFTQAYPWAHLDVAGTASQSGDAKGATGRPVPLLSEFLLHRAKQA